ncbi:MAG TPA: AcvB/VirJ family lysyl-phosphatidylglycerol hydrolase [Steroidobacteraceae bacterium]|nr:AcvB/VirJ family lysyl-phosphatidylglycerol hydrolase [Steroidobacteraceae bacterium]
MTRWWSLLLLWSCAQCGAETLSHGRFENIEIYRPTGDVQRVVLFLSGQQGWTQQLTSSAQLLASQGALVAGIDSRGLFAQLEHDVAECVYPDGDLENLSHFLQAYYRLPGYEPAYLVGYDAGASLGYAMLAQAPPETFAGAISIDFCPELQLRKHLCKAGTLDFAGTRKGRDVLAPVTLEAPWIVLQRHAAGVCGTAVTQRFVGAAPGSEMITLAASSADWAADVSTAVQRLAARRPRPRHATPEDLEGLPVVEVPATSGGTSFAILITGDGGWAGIDKAVAAALAEKGIPVVGVDSLRYFWKERTPQSTAADVERIVRHYLAAWDKKDVVLIGYSQGADVLPFIVNRLPEQTRARMQLVAMLGLGERALFEFHLSNWLADDDAGLPIAPELQRMAGIPALCVYSDDPDDTSCDEAASRSLRAVRLPGGHHFGGDYERLAELILEGLKPPPQPSPDDRGRGRKVVR